MLIDARELDDGRRVDADVCIVGAGAAGITLARELAAARRSVVLLEAGGLAFDDTTQAMYAGSVADSDPALPADYLTTSRLRFLGGTTNHWEGWCRPFDPIDFEARSWVPLSGWPFGREELDPYYDRACRHLQIDRLDEPADSPRRSPAAWLFPSGTRMQTTFFRQAAPVRFGAAYREELAASPHVQLLTWANAIEVTARPEGTSIERVRVAGVHGKGVDVYARAFVLAAGAIEVARLLLASRSVHANGLGNEHDMVGRCFMEHPRIERVGAAALLRRGDTVPTYTIQKTGPTTQVWGALTASADMQRDRRLLNGCFALEPGPGPLLAPEVAALADAVDRLRPSSAPADPAPTFAFAMINCEQAPNRESRVQLDNERDELGVPRARLTWKLSEIDRTSTRSWLQVLAIELARAGLGRGAFNIDPIDPWRNVQMSGHHIGTARMSTDPKLGVVDADQRVHGLSNLYVASAATFPTSGLASPTPTIVALAVRIADKLLEDLA